MTDREVYVLNQWKGACRDQYCDSYIQARGDTAANGQCPAQPGNAVQRNPGDGSDTRTRGGRRCTASRLARCRSDPLDAFASAICARSDESSAPDGAAPNCSFPR